jgi:phospholipid/cholesterol/gamma-HCH transport system substrate-binding protein
LEAKTNYTLVGLAVLILTSGLLATALWLSVGLHNKVYTTYAVYLHEAANGLSEEAPVKFSGVTVGYVKSIQLNQKDPQQVILILNIESHIPVTDSTYAQLISQGITGNSYVGLQAKTSSLTRLKKVAGYPYPVIPSKPSLFTQIDIVLREVSDNINKVSEEIRDVFNRENQDNLQKTLRNLQQFTLVLSKKSRQFGDVIENSQNISKNFSKASNNFPKVLQDFDQTLQEIKNMASSMKKAGNEVSKTMQSGEQAVNQINLQIIPPATDLIYRLEAIANNLDAVSKSMRSNPSVIVRGMNPPKPGPGEKK